MDIGYLSAILRILPSTSNLKPLFTIIFLIFNSLVSWSKFTSPSDNMNSNIGYMIIQDKWGSFTCAI